MLKLALHWQILIAMILGATLGILLNLWASRNETQSLAGEVREWTISDSSNHTEIKITESGKTDAYVVDSDYMSGSVPGNVEVDDAGITRHYFVTVGQLDKKYPEVYRLYLAHGRSWSRYVGDISGSLGGLFLRLLKMVSIPLIVTSLLTGITGLGHASRIGPMFGRTLGYYFVTSLLAIITGLLMVNIIRPGERGPRANVPAVAAVAVEAAADGNHSGGGLGSVLWEQLLNLIPTNPMESLAGGNFLSIISFTLAFAIFSIAVGGNTLDTVRNLAEAGFEVMMRMTMAIIRLAPIGVLFMMLGVTASQGGGVFKTLAWYILAVACALAIHAMVTLPAILKFVAKRNPWEYAKAMSPALLTAFSSASSNGTLPLTLTCVEQRAKVSNRVSSFVLPLGATINMDGTALYEAVAVLFIAQMTPGFETTMSQQIIVVITALLASVGAAGIPHAGLVMMVIILDAVGLPTEKQAMIIGVDRLLDMCRTSVNVWSDSCGCAVVARFEAARKAIDTPGPMDLEDQP